MKLLPLLLAETETETGFIRFHFTSLSTTRTCLLQCCFSFSRPDNVTGQGNDPLNPIRIYIYIYMIYPPQLRF
jgi:hypothetical protein